MATNLTFDIIARDRASSKFDKVGNSAEKAGGKFGKFAKAGATAVAGLAIAAGALAVKFGVSAVGAASDLNETLSKSNAIFGKNAGAMEKWAAGGARSMGLSKASALAAASGFGDMFSQIGFAGKEAANMSKDVVQMSADLGSFNNLPTADVADRMSAAFRGEYDSLQALIPNINAARVEQVALATTGKESADALTAQEKAAAVLAIVHKDGAKASGDFARTSGGLANQQKILKAQFENVQASIGQKLLPVAVKLATWMNDKLIPAVSKTWGWLQQKLGPVFTKVGGFIRDVVVPAIKDLVGRFTGASTGTNKLQKALQDAQPFFAALKGIVNALAVVFREVLWPIIKKVADVALPAIGKALGAVGKVGIWLWNNALQPAFKFILTGVGWLMKGFGKMLQTLGNVPGFGWAKKAGDKMFAAGEEALGLRDKIRKIPDRKDVAINVKVRQTGRVTLPNGVTSNVPQFAGGVRNFRGGLAYVHKDELLELPPGTNVRTASETRRMTGSTRSVAREEYAPVVLQLDSRTIWQGMLRLKRVTGQPMGLT